MRDEAKFQSNLIQELYKTFEGCIVLKNDASYISGIPDLLVLYKDKWAALECKRSDKAKFRPGQKYYLRILNEMSYAAKISPENKKEIINELRILFGTG